jgi:hypothetical protein
MSKPKVFISYCHADEAPWKNRLQKHLEVLDRRGSLSFWEDRQIAAGVEWQAEINAALESAEAAILLISVDFLRSKFIRDEEVPVIMQRRMQEGMKVFPLLLRSCPWQKEEWLSHLQVRPTDGKPLAQFDKDDDIDRVLAEFASEIETLLNHTPAPIIAVPITNQECPYLGLEAFTEDKRHLFFGRDNFIEAIWQKLQERQFVAVVGPSGCGKSSVIQAGVFPRLGGEWRKLVFQPGDDPFLNLADKFVEVRGESSGPLSKRIKAAAAMAQQIRENRSIAATVAETLAALPQPSRLLVVADQFEELFTLTPVAARQPFVEALLAAARLTELKVLVTLRADFFGQAVSLTPELSQLLQDGLVTHRPLQRVNWEAVILQPAKTVGLHIDPALVALILEEIEAQPDSLPLLEYALKELWQQRTPSGIGLTQYEVIGRLAGAINQRADAVLAQLSEEDQKLALRALTRLVRVSGGEEEGADTRLRLPLNELTAEQREVLQSFINERLLVTNRHERTGEETIEVAHEALIRRWEKLREAIESDREFLVWRRWLNVRRNLWQQKARDGKWVLAGGEVEDAQRWQQERSADLTKAEIEFITWVDRPEFQIEHILAKAPDLLLFSDQRIQQGWFTALVFCGEQERAILLAREIEKGDARGGALQATAEALAQAALVTDALAIICEIEEAYYRAKALQSIAKALVKAGLVKEVLVTARKIQEADFRAWTMQSIAEALMKAGLITKACEIATEALVAACEVEKGDHRLRIMQSIAKAFVKAGLVAEALAAVREIERTADRASALPFIAEILMKVGLDTEAREVATIAITAARETKEHRDVYISIAAEALAKAALATEALAGTREIVSRYHRIRALQSIAETLLKTGLATEAREVATEALAVARESVSSHERTIDLQSIAETLVKTGLFTEALEAVYEIEETNNRTSALQSIAKALMKEGLIMQALAVAHKIEWFDVRTSALQSIAEALAKVGLVTEALTVAREIKMPNAHASALMFIADFWLEQEQQGKIESLLEEIQASVGNIYSTAERSSAERQLAIILAGLHRYREARELADQCQHEDRLAAYTAILREYHLERDPSLARLFAEEAADAEEED